MNKEHEYYMKKVLKLAEKGRENVSPNPMVGALIVYKGKIISRGYHKKPGALHAEVDALKKVKNKDLLKKSTMYVNLEPCCHTNKRTPPCVPEIIKSGIPKIIVGMKDPNEFVAGKGISILRRNNIKVEFGILKHECIELNKIFIKHITKKRPFIFLKIAQTVDGKIATSNYHSKWITNQESRNYAHYLRSMHDAIMIGKNTLLHDNPKLNIRNIKNKKINELRKIVIGDFSNFNNHKNLHLFKSSNIENVLLLNNSQKISSELKEFPHVFYKGTNPKRKMTYFLKEIYKKGISSILVEGGSTLASSLMESKLVDEIGIFISPKILGSGHNALKLKERKNIQKAINIDVKFTKFFNEDFYLQGTPTN